MTKPILPFHEPFRVGDIVQVSEGRGCVCGMLYTSSEGAGCRVVAEIVINRKVPLCIVGCRKHYPGYFIAHDPMECGRAAATMAYACLNRAILLAPGRDMFLDLGRSNHWAKRARTLRHLAIRMAGSQT